jgi:hypothetical protein
VIRKMKENEEELGKFREVLNNCNSKKKNTREEERVDEERKEEHRREQ